MGDRMQGMHNFRCDKIALHPKTIDLDNILISASETNLFNTHGVLIGQTDSVLIQPDTKTIYVTEYKCNKTHNHKHLEQLRRAYDLYTQSFSTWTVIPIYVYEEYHTERLR